MTSRLIISIILLAVSTVSSFFVWQEYVAGATTQNNPILLTTFFLFTAILMTDKVAACFIEYFSQKESSETWKKIEHLPSLFVGRNDIATFSTSYEGAKYCMAVVPMAKFVRNTVLRYGSTSTGMPYQDGNMYEKWILAKRASLEKECVWTEVVSRHIAADDPQSIFMEDVKKSGKYYTHTSLDDKQQAAIQMIIFEFADGHKEVLFGWEFPAMPQGPCFLTRNEKVIGYFESYFTYLQKLAA